VAELKGEAAEVEDEEPIRIDLMVDAHLPDGYVASGEGRLEAYRRLAAARDQEAIDDVVAEWEDRYGPLPGAAIELINLARLRAEAIRLGITEILQNRREVKVAPVTLRASEEVRLQRVERGAVLRGATLYLPSPEASPATAITRFIRTLWPPSDDRPEVP
jgi:transcription-repair coupling factor (superfamily II helicase)